MSATSPKEAAETFAAEVFMGKLDDGVPLVVEVLVGQHVSAFAISFTPVAVLCK